MIIEELEITLGDFKDLTAQAPDGTPGGQEVISLHAVPITGEADSDHDVSWL
jgi:hypothetical protein